MNELFQEFTFKKDEKKLQDEMHKYFLKIKETSNTENKKRIKTYAISVDTHDILNSCPILKSILEQRIKVEMIDLFRFYVTPAGTKMGIHIDGSSPKVPFGLNFPVFNSADNYMNWYDIPEDQMHLFDAHKKYGYMPSFIPKKGADLKIIQSKQIDKPYFVKTDIMHNVVNNTDNDRIILSVRFLLDKAIQDPEEILL